MLDLKPVLRTIENGFFCLTEWSLDGKIKL